MITLFTLLSPDPLTDRYYSTDEIKELPLSQDAKKAMLRETARADRENSKALKKEQIAQAKAAKKQKIVDEKREKNRAYLKMKADKRAETKAKYDAIAAEHAKEKAAKMAKRAEERALKAKEKNSKVEKEESYKPSHPIEEIQEFWLHNINPITGRTVEAELVDTRKYIILPEKPGKINGFSVY